MKRIRTLAIALSILTLPTLAHSYVGVGLGYMHETTSNDEFGYTLDLGAKFIGDLGFSTALVGFFNDAAAGNAYWIQGNVNLWYDFGTLWKNAVGAFDFHPYLKGGFTYAGYLFDAGATLGTEASHGPGFNIGGGWDWKLLPFLTVGIDIAESWVWMNGVTAGGVTLTSDYTAKVFQLMGMVKFFAY